MQSGIAFAVAVVLALVITSTECAAAVAEYAMPLTLTTVAAFDPLVVTSPLSSADVAVWVEPANRAIPAPGEDATTTLAATTLESAGTFDAPNLTRFPFVPAKDVPLILETVTASVPEVVASPDRSPFVIEVEPENFVRFPLAGLPVVVTEPVPEPQSKATTVKFPLASVWTQRAAVADPLQDASTDVFPVTANWLTANGVRTSSIDWITPPLVTAL